MHSLNGDKITKRSLRGRSMEACKVDMSRVFSVNVFDTMIPCVMNLHDQFWCMLVVMLLLKAIQPRKIS